MSAAGITGRTEVGPSGATPLVLWGRPVPDRAWAEAQLRLVALVLAPLALVVPLRILGFPDTTPLALLLLGPLTEEALKFAIVLVALSVLAVVRPAEPSAAWALGGRLLATPWMAGGAYGLYEGLAAYRLEAGIDLALRVAAHAGFASLAFAVALNAWSRGRSVGRGVGTGLLAGLAAHGAFNAFVLAANVAAVSVSDQILYAGAVLLLAAILLRRAATVQPRSRAVRRLLSPVLWIVVSGRP